MQTVKLSNAPLVIGCILFTLDVNRYSLSLRAATKSNKCIVSGMSGRIKGLPVFAPFLLFSTVQEVNIYT